MNDTAQPVNTIAPLRNVGLFAEAVNRAMQRPDHLPGLITFAGPSGFGKSVAATYSANELRAYYVAAKSTWTKKALTQSILKEMGIAPAKTVYDMVEQIAEQLALSGRPLFIDEMDHLVAKGNVEVIRDIYESSNAAIILIGEEQLPAKLQKWERFHGRVLDWVQAQPAGMADARLLAKMYCSKLKVGEALLGGIVEASKGSVRRICVNLERVRELALAGGIDAIDLPQWGEREFYTGQVPARRRRG